jgi:hypothetical protein
MAKLAQYMADFAALLGKEHAVHFDHLEGGSVSTSRSLMIVCIFGSGSTHWPSVWNVRAVLRFPTLR